MQTTILMMPGQTLRLPLEETDVDPEGWATQDKISGTAEATSAKLSRKDFTAFLHQTLYPLRPEEKQGLQTIIDNLKSQGPLRSCNKAPM
jgi:hypothetical protein